MFEVIGIITMFVGVPIFAVWVVRLLEKPMKTTLNLPHVAQATTCPFCNNSLTPIFQVSMVRLQCDGKDCPVSPRTYWAVNIDAAIEAWNRQQWPNKPEGKVMLDTGKRRGKG